MLIFLSLMKMDTPSENSISWGGIIFVALARNVLVLRFRSAIGQKHLSILTILHNQKVSALIHDDKQFGGCA